MNGKIHKFAFVVIFIIAATVFAINYRNNTNEIKNEACIKAKAEITNVFPSGRGYRISTLLTVKYTLDGIDKTATIRRSGYKEGAYSKGDTTTIYINPNDNEDIR